MPGSTAQRGDIYLPRHTAITVGDTHSTPRRVVCVAELPSDPEVWRAMSRTTTAYDASIDLFSPADSTLGLTKDGWWSHRFIRSIRKRLTGHPHDCAYLATIPEPLKSTVLDHYKNR